MATFPSPPLASDPPTKLKLSSPGDILAAVPYLLGFAPARSVVVLCLQGKMLGLTMRLDLDTPAAEMHEMLLERIAADGADTAVIVFFDPDAGSGSRRAGDLMARSLIRAFREDGISVRDALGVREGRFWSYLCKDTTCCPTDGRLLPVSGAADHSNVSATFVRIGSAPLASREQLVETLAPVTGSRREEMVACIANALERPAANPVGRWWTVVSRYDEGPPRPGGGLTMAEAAYLVVSLRDVRLRDEIISWTADVAGGLLTVLRELAPLALPPFDAQVLVTLAWAAYTFGDGALAAMALDRALDSDPTHSLAKLLFAALEGGIAPDQLQGISEELQTFSEAGAPRRLNPDDWNWGER